jgi:hypothetical protein
MAMTIARPLALALLLSLVGCGTAAIGGSNRERDADDVDAGAGADDDDSDDGMTDDDEVDADPVEEACGVKASLGAVGSVTGSGISETNVAVPGESISFTAAISVEAPIDQLQIELYEDYGQFDGGIHTGSFSISGDDADPVACGACVYVAANVTSSDGPEHLYFARSGTLRIDDLGTTLAGTLSNATLVEVDIETGSILPSTCATKVVSAAFGGALSYP